MPKMPQKPQVGQKALQSIYNTVCDIVDYLPAVTVRGDGNTTAVDNTPIGTIVHARPQAFNMQNGNGSKYYAGSGIQFLSGNIINSKISAGPNINIDYNSGWLVISGTPAASGGGGSDTNDTYIGDANYYNYLSGNHIYVSPDADYNGSHLVSSTLNWLQELNNNKFCESGRVTFPTTAHVITSNVGVNSDHCITPTDLIHDGLGTTVNYSWMRSPFGDEPTAMIGLVDGLQVDLTLSGGKYADVVLYQNKGGFGPISQETEPPTQSTINVLLSGDGDVDPTTGHIFIRDVDYGNGISGGIIYTDLQGGGGSNIPTPEAGKILSCDNNGMTWQPNTGGGGGSGFIPDWGHSKHDFGVPPTTSKPQHPTVAEHDGYLFAWASFNPSQLGYCFQTAQAHIVVNDAWMKVCEVSYPDKFYIVVNNNKFQRYPYGDIIHQMMLTGTTAGSGDTTQTISPTLYYRNDGDDVWDENDEYVQYHGWTASSRDEILPSKIFTQNYLLRPFNENWSIYFKKYNVYEYQNGQRGSWLTSYIDGYNINVSDLLQSIGYTGNWEEEAFFDQQWGLKGSAGNQIDRACWQYNGDYIYTNGSIDNGTSTYELTQTGLDEKRQDYNYVGDVTDNNMKMQAIGVGGGLCVPFRKGATLSYVVNMDGRAVNIPTNYGTSGMTWAPAACCIVYYNHST